MLPRDLTSDGVAPLSSVLIARAVRILRVDAIALALALAGMVVIFSVLSPYFLSQRNFLNIGSAVAVTGIVAAGTTIALVSGALDLSIASVMDLAAVVTGTLSGAGIHPAVAIMAGLICGTLVGVCNGLVVTRLRINPIIATLASGLIVAGIAFLLTSGVASTLTDPAFATLGRSRVVGVPMPILICAGTWIMTFLVLRRTHFGRMVYAIGGNPVACALAGINVDRWRVLFFVASSLSASAAGIVLLSEIGAVLPNGAAGTVLTIIAAVILGGTSLAGGSGSIQGTIIGVLILGTLNNGLILLNINAYWQQILSGLVLIIAVAADRFRTGGYR